MNKDAAVRTSADLPHGLGLGCWSFADIGTGTVDDKNSARIIEAALAGGIRHFDTAQSYGQGYSETVLGRELAGCGEEVFIATKLHGAGAAETRSKVAQSLERLKRDRLDLVYIHWPKRGFDNRPMMEALEDLRSMGLISLIGVSNFSVDDMETATEAGHIDVHQIGYNLLWRFPEQEVIPYCREKGISIVTYSSIAQGLLSDKQRSPDSFEKGDPRAKTLFYQPEVWPRLFPLVHEMQELSKKAGKPLSDAAVQWVLGRPGVASSLVGARSVEQLKQLISLGKKPVDEQLMAALTAISDTAMQVVPNAGNIFLHYP